jgi:Phage capsid family
MTASVDRFCPGARAASRHSVQEGADRDQDQKGDHDTDDRRADATDDPPTDAVDSSKPERREISNTAGSSFVYPTGIAMHPVNWMATRLLTDSTGQFLGSGPFGTAAQNAGAAGLFGQSLWNVPVALTTTVGLGTAVVGGYATAAAIARRSGVTVEATNSHQDYFVKDLVSIRAEQREALMIYRPEYFTVVSGLS